VSLKITARETVRHALHRAGLSRLLIRRHVAHGRQVGHLALADRRDVFDYIYREGVWLNERADGARSGAGSSAASVAELKAELPTALRQLGVSSLLDVGCGEFGWLQDLDDRISYTGVDIVPSVIDANQQRYGRPNRLFRVLDAVEEPLPTADAVLCREVLFHLSFADAARLIANVKRSAATYFLATTDVATSVNSDIRTGDFRIINLRKRPFKFPDPTVAVRDDAIMPGRVIGAWPVADLPGVGERLTKADG
jgi:SAM-dependent methyltransferase